MNALNTSGSTIAVILGGTLVPLPNNQILDGFTVDAANQVFTVPTSGTYLIMYRVSTTASLLLSSRVLLNGAALAGSTFTPALAGTTFQATLFASLAEGNTLSLQLFGLLGTAVLQSGNGANFTVVRLS